MSSHLLLQGIPLISAAPCIVHCWRVEITEMSRAVGRLLSQCGRKHQPADCGNLDLGKETLSVALMQQTGLRRRLHHHKFMRLATQHGPRLCQFVAFEHSRFSKISRFYFSGFLRSEAIGIAHRPPRCLLCQNKCRHTDRPTTVTLAAHAHRW